MLGFSPLGTRPIAMLVDLPVPVTVFAAVGQVKVYTVEVFAPADGSRLIAAATREFITKPSDILANYPFHGDVDMALSFERSVVGGFAFNGASSGYGEVELNNADGAYDDIGPLAGARIIIKMGWLGASFDTYMTLVDGYIAGVNAEIERLRIELDDNTSKLDVPVQSALYAGTGLGEGDSSLAQKRKPMAFGSPSNVTPVFVDPVNLVYDLHAGAIYPGAETAGEEPVYGVTAVRDRGFELVVQNAWSGPPYLFPDPNDFANYAALIAATVDAGKYITCVAEGRIRLGALAQQVTVDFHGAASADDTYYQSTANILGYLFQLHNIAYDAGSFSALEFEYDPEETTPANVDYVVAQDATLQQVVDDLLGGIGAYGGPRRDGVFDVGRIDIPDADNIAAVYREMDIFDIQRVPLPSSISPPPWRVRIPYKVNWTVQTDLAAATNEITAAYVAEQHKTAEASDPDLLNDNPRATDPEPRKAFYSGESSDAATLEANRFLAMVGYSELVMLKITVASGAFAHNIGSTVQIFHSRFGLSVGKTVVVVGTRDSAGGEDSVELTVVGIA